MDTARRRSSLALNLDRGVQIGVCLCIGSFALFSDWRVALVMLGMVGITATLITKTTPSRGTANTLLLPVILFLLTTAATTLASIDIGKSLILNLSLLPAGLLGYLIAVHFRDITALRLLFCTCALGVSIMAAALLGIAWFNPGVHPSTWINQFGSPLLLVPNDTTLFALLAPFSLALAWRAPRGFEALLAVASLALGTAAMVVYQNGIGLLALLLGLSIMTFLLNRRVALWTVSTLLLLGVAADAWLGWPLLGKFVGLGQRLDPRWPLWLSAWSVFLEHPWLGTGPHTFGLIYENYFQQLTLPAWFAHDPRHTPWVHNLYLETLAEQGLVGALALGFLFYRGLVLVWWTLARAPNLSRRIYTVALLGGFSCFLFAASFELSFKRLWVLLGLTILLGVSAVLASSTEIRK
jgi:O-antigen ligase